MREEALSVSPILLPVMAVVTEHYMNRYILRGKEVFLEKDMQKWERWFKSVNRSIRRSEKNNILISTVFLALDHNFMGRKPFLFETMVFQGGKSIDMERYSTYNEAVSGHESFVRKYHEHDSCVILLP